MNRARIGSLLALLCGILVVCSLLTQLVNEPTSYPYFQRPQPPAQYVGLSIGGAYFAASVGLWLQRRWGRLIFFITGSIFLFLSLGFFPIELAYAGTPMSNYRYALLSQPLLAASYYFARLACSVESLQCYEAAACVQPILTILTMAVLVKPLASNNRWRGP